MRKFKKSLAFALAAAMIVTAVPVSAAAAPTAKLGTSTLYANGIGKYKTTYVSVSKGYTFKHSTKNTKVLALGKTSGVQAKAAGKTRTGTAKAVVTVKIYKGKKVVATKNLNVTVKPAAYAVSVKVDKKSINLGDTAQATGTMATAKASGSIRYYSSNTAVATVDAKTGKITAKAGGTTKITAVTTISRKTSAAVEVTVVADAPVAKQTGAKTITITNGVSMKDKTITVKKGESNVTLAKDGIKLSDDGLTATVETMSNIVEGAYVVTIGDKTSEFTGQVAQVDKIEITSKYAILTTNASPTDAYAYYKVTNQFGEDVTSTTNVTVNGSFVDTNNASIQKEGKINFKNTNEFRLNDIVTAVVTYNEDGKVVTSGSVTLNISNKAVADSIEIAKVYNEDGKELNEDTLLTDEFYLLAVVKDQYGNKITESKAGNDPFLNVSVANSQTNVKIDTTVNFEKKKVDGVDYMAIPVTYDQANKKGTGNCTIVMMGQGGKNITYILEIKSGKKVDKFSVQPGGVTLAAGDKDVELPYTAVDGSGNDVTDIDELKQVTLNFSSNITYKWASGAKTGKPRLLVTVPNTASNGFTASVTAIANTTNVDNKTLTVKAQAYPYQIRSVEDISTGVFATGTVKVKASDIKLEDQYGREFDMPASGNLTINNKNYKLLLEINPGSTPAFTYAKNGTSISTASGSAVTTTLESGAELTATGTAVGNEDVKIVIQSKSSSASNFSESASHTLKLQCVDAKRITNYEVKSLGTIFAGATQAGDKLAKEFKVYGKVGSTKIELPESMYSVTSPNGYFAVGNAGTPSAVDMKLYLQDDLTATGKALEKETSITEKVTVTITNTAANDGLKVLTQDVIISKANATVNEAKVVDHNVGTSTGIVGDKKEATITVPAGTVNLADLIVALEIKTQFGESLKGETSGKYKLGSGSTRNNELTPAFTIDPKSIEGTSTATPYTISKNGANDAKITNFVSNASMSVKMTVGGYNYTFVVEAR